MPVKINWRLLYTLLSALVVILGTTFAISYANGNWRVTREGFKPRTGLLAANSEPRGAEVYIDGRLVSATDDTLYLDPGQYQVSIVKEGFWPWQKTLQIQEELVTSTNALLFPIAPSLSPLTFNGAQNILPSPDGQKIVFYSASASAQPRNGLYVLEMTTNPLGLNRQARQIAQDSSNLLDLAQAELIWAPDSNQLLVVTDQKEALLDVFSNTDLATAQDVSFQRDDILAGWEEEMYLRERQFLARFPDEIIQIATASAQNVYISPDKKRILYTATASATLAEGLVPPIDSINTQPQTRNLEPGIIYLYDREEDTNFAVGLDTSFEATQSSPKQLLATDLYNRAALELESSPAAFTRLQASTAAQTADNFHQYHTALYSHGLQWFTTSQHLLFAADGAIKVKSFDNTNEISLYTGPFDNNFVFPWPDGSKLVVLTSFSADSPANLYAIELR